MIVVFAIGAIAMGVGAVLAGVADSKSFKNGIGGKIADWYAGDEE